MGIVKNCIILIALILICALLFICLRLANALNPSQPLVYDFDLNMRDYDNLLVINAKAELEHLLTATWVIMVGCVFCIFYVLYVHISQCIRNSGERRVMYDVYQTLSTSLAAVLFYILVTLREKLNNVLAVSNFKILNDVDFWIDDVTKLSCKLVTCTFCLIIICIGCIKISQRSGIRGNNAQIDRRFRDV